MQIIKNTLIKLVNKICKKNKPKDIITDNRPIRRCSLGIDFGAHGTKIAYQHQHSEKAMIININDNKMNYQGWTNNVFPSIITVYNGKLYFGLPSHPGEQIKNFKLYVGQDKVEPITNCTYEELTTFFLNYVLQKSISKIEQNEQEYKCITTFQLGFPGLLSNENKRKLRYQEILTNIWRIHIKLKDTAFQGIELNLMKEILDAVKTLKVDEEDRKELKEENVWRWLIPEIQASIAALAQEIIIPYRSFHIVIDLGGYTTDVGIFTVGKNKGHYKIATVFTWDTIYRSISEYGHLEDKVTRLNILRNEIIKIISIPRINNLLNNDFIHKDKKVLWKLGGGSIHHPELVNELFNENLFLPAYKNFDRNPTVYEEQAFFIVVKGLSIRNDRLLKIVNATKLPQNSLYHPDNNDETIPYELQDVG